MKNNILLDPIIIRKSSLILLFRVIFVSLFFNIAFLMTSVGYAYARQYLSRPTISEVTIFLVFFIIEIIIFIVLAIIWFSEYIKVDNHFILHKTGVLFTKEIRYKLDTINNMTVEQNPFNRLFQYGSIRISHSNNELAFFHSIPYPNKFIYMVEQKIEMIQEKNSED